MEEDEDYGPYFSADHAEAVKDLRRCIERKDFSEAMLILDRFFNDSGDPR